MSLLLKEQYVASALQLYNQCKAKEYECNLKYCTNKKGENTEGYAYFLLYRQQVWYNKIGGQSE